MSEKSAIKPIKISVALCTYNGAKFLREQLESIKTQTVLPDELVVGDDFSNDSTVSIIERFAESAPFPVRLKINENNLGSTVNFEQTILRCGGEIIFLCDQDDVWLPNKIETIIAEFEKEPEIGMIFTNAEIVDENLSSHRKQFWKFNLLPEHRRKVGRGEFFEIFLRGNIAIGATMAFRAKFRESFTPIPAHIPNLIHDAWIALIIAAQASVKFIDTPLIKYRQHSGQQIGVNYEKQDRQTRYEKSIAYCRKEIERLTLMRDVLNDFPPLQSARKLNSFDALIDFYLVEKQRLIEHYTARMNLSATRLKRIPVIWREIQNGGYRRFSKGWLSAAKDLFRSE